MKTNAITIGSILILCIAPCYSLPYQFSFHKTSSSHRFGSQVPHAEESLTPYTIPWVNELQSLYNTFGESRNNTSCPAQIQEWKCEPYGLTEQDMIKPLDVWHLRPHDIKAIISIGDSITAGFAMVSGRPPFATVLEFRGKVFSGGGDNDEYTLTNFLRTYRKHVRGSPSGFTLPLAFGKGLNTAVSGAIAQSLPSQIARLKRLFRFGGTYHRYKKEWKVTTLFIGANNICAACGQGDSIPKVADPDEYGAVLRSALRELRDAIGPTFVNLVGIFDVSLVYDLSRGYPYCELLFDKIPFPICGCATGNEADRQRAGDLATKYNEVMEQIAQEINEESDGNFGVVYQPGLTNFKERSSPYGQGYMSGLDCFHPNKCANQVMAIILWNNMFSSRGNKHPPRNSDELKIYCPGPSDYLQ